MKTRILLVLILLGLFGLFVSGCDNTIVNEPISVNEIDTAIVQFRGFTNYQSYAYSEIEYTYIDETIKIKNSKDTFVLDCQGDVRRVTLNHKAKISITFNNKVQKFFDFDTLIYYANVDNLEIRKNGTVNAFPQNDSLKFDFKIYK